MTLVRYLRPLAVAVLLVSSWSGAASAQAPAPDFDAFYVFGDSLADVGNVWLTARALQITPAPPPSETPNLTYFRGRFSNGPVAVEYLWQQVSGRAPGTAGALRPYVAAPWLGAAGAVDFAFGGTGTPLLDQTPGGLYAPGLLGQVELFRLALAGRPPAKKSLYLLMTGPNDYRIDQYNVPMAPTQVVNNIATAAARLYALGARDILVLTMPDLGQLPYLTPAQVAQGTAVTQAHNALLAQAIASLDQRLPKARLRVVDVNVVFETLRGQMNAQVPALDVLLPPIGPLTPMSACLFVNPALCTDVPLEWQRPDGTFATPFPLLFWDVVHPTTEAHRALADYLYDQLRQ